MSSDSQIPKHEPPWPTEASGVWATYDFHCHCGAVRYTVKMSPPLYEEHSEGKGVWKVNECTCSWCERNGNQTIHPLAENFTWTRGEDNLTKYRFGNKNVDHLICKTCGSCVASDAVEMFAKMGKPPRMVLNVSVYLEQWFERES